MTGKRIDEMYCFSVVDEDGNEGIIGMNFGNGWMPFVGADMDRVDSLKPYAQKICNIKGTPVTLRRFNRSELLCVLTPKGKKA